MIRNTDFRGLAQIIFIYDLTQFTIYCLSIKSYFVNRKIVNQKNSRKSALICVSELTHYINYLNIRKHPM